MKLKKLNNTSKAGVWTHRGRIKRKNAINTRAHGAWTNRGRVLSVIITITEESTNTRHVVEHARRGRTLLVKKITWELVTQGR
jgi:hypothetical protein